jgi:hypothetical protein
MQQKLSNFYYALFFKANFSPINCLHILNDYQRYTFSRNYFLKEHKIHFFGEQNDYFLN